MLMRGAITHRELYGHLQRNIIDTKSDELTNNQIEDTNSTPFAEEKCNKLNENENDDCKENMISMKKEHGTEWHPSKPLKRTEIIENTASFHGIKNMEVNEDEKDDYKEAINEPTANIKCFVGTQRTQSVIEVDEKNDGSNDYENDDYISHDNDHFSDEYGFQFLNCRERSDCMNTLMKCDMRKGSNGRGIVYITQKQIKQIWKKLRKSDKLRFPSYGEFYNYLRYSVKVHFIDGQALKCELDDGSEICIFDTDLYIVKGGDALKMYGVLIPNDFKEKGAKNWKFKLFDFFIVNNDNMQLQLPTSPRNCESFIAQKTHKISMNSSEFKEMVNQTVWGRSKKASLGAVDGSPLIINIDIDVMNTLLCIAFKNGKSFIPIVILKGKEYRIGQVLIVNYGNIVIGVSFRYSLSEKKWNVFDISANTGDLARKWRLVEPKLDPNNALFRKLMETQSKQNNIRLRIIKVDDAKPRNSEQRSDQGQCLYVRQGCGSNEDPPCLFKKECAYFGNCTFRHSPEEWIYFYRVHWNFYYH